MVDKVHPRVVGITGSTTIEELGDDANFTFGTDDDFAIRYNSSQDALEFFDLVNNTGIRVPRNVGYALDAIPNNVLQASSINISPGNALEGGGNLSLGGSASFGVATDGIQTDELDLSISPTWTGQHTFQSSIIANAGIKLDGRLLERVTQTSSNKNTNGESVVFVNSNAGAITITLSTADTKSGNTVAIVDADNNAGTNNITINTEGSQQINNSSSEQIINDGAAKTFKSNGSDWYSAGSAGTDVFVDTDSDGIAELEDEYSGIQLGDDKEVQLSSDGSVSFRYESSAGLVTFDGSSPSILTISESSGDLDVAGDVSLEDDNELQLSSDGSVLVKYDSSGSTITFANGATTLATIDVTTGDLQGEGNIGVKDGNEFQLSTDDSVSLRYVSADSTIRFAGAPSLATGDTISSFGAPSGSPQGTGVDSSDCIWTSDFNANSIYKTDQTGSVVSKFTSPSSSPTGLEVDASDSIWLASTDSNKIYKLRQSGTLITTINTPSSGPQGIGIDTDSCLWHADTTADSIYQLDKAGSIISQFATPSSSPQGVGLDNTDSIWSSDISSDKYYKLNQSGSVVTSFAAPSTLPRGIGLDSGGDIWTADSGTNLVYEISASSDTPDILSLNRTSGDLETEGTLTENASL